MNLFKSLLFLEGHITDPSILDDDFAATYGNKRASERRFRDAFTQPQFARPNDAVDACSPAGCG